MDHFTNIRLVQVANGQNWHTDSLATLALSLIEGVPLLIKVKLVTEPSINAGVDVSLVSTVELCWMDPIIDFLAEDRVLADEKEAEKVRQTTARYWLSTEWKLYRRPLGEPYLQFLHPSKIEELPAELHDEVCDSHMGGRSLAPQVMTQGFWWLQTQKYATEYAWKCESCQKHAPMIHQLAGNLNRIVIPWPFV